MSLACIIPRCAYRTVRANVGFSATSLIRVGGAADLVIAPASLTSPLYRDKSVLSPGKTHPGYASYRRMRGAEANLALK
jgi:hypothetical protein